MRKVIIPILLMVLIAPVAFGWGATRSISGNEVTVNIDETGGTGIFSLQETVTGATITGYPANCGLAGEVLTCDSDDSGQRVIVYQTDGTGTVSGVITGGYPATEQDILGDTEIGGTGPDITPPVISSLAANPTETSAVIDWFTDEAANAILYYGLTASLGGEVEDPAMSTLHSFTMTGLSEGTTYYYQAESCDASDNCAQSSVLSFTTPSTAAAADDLQVNYIRGVLRLDGTPAPAGTKVRVTVLNGENAGQTYIAAVDDSSIPSFLRGNGYFDTLDQVIFSTGAQFSIEGYDGYECANDYTGTFINGGNGDFNTLVNLANYNCQFVEKFAPEITSYSPASSAVSIDEGQSQLFQITAMDPDNDLPLTYSYKLDGVEVSTVSTYNYNTDYSSAGTHTLVVKVSDATEMYDEYTWTINVQNANRNPTLNPIGSLTAVEGQLFEYTVTASDPDSDALLFSSNSPIFQINSQTGVISFTPANDDVGVYSIEFTVTDINGGSDSETVLFTVQNVNDAPVLSPIGDRTGYEEVEIQIQLSAVDPDGDVLTYYTDAAIGTFDPVTGLFTYTPPKGPRAEYEITFGVSDGTATDEEVITLTVIPVLEITDITLIVDGVPISAEPGDTIIAGPYSDVSTSVTVRNNINEPIYGIGVLYDIPSLGISNEEYISSLNPGNSQTREYQMNLPAIINEGTYDYIIRAEDINDAHQAFYDEATLHLDVVKENNKLLIENVEFATDPMQCTRNNQISVSLVNIGVFDLTDTELHIQNSNLGIDITETIANIPANTRYTGVYDVQLDNVIPGTHNVDVQADYFYVKRETESAQLSILDCSINDISPDPSQIIYITEDGWQDFHVGVPNGVFVNWYLNGVLVGTGEDYTYYGDGLRGRYDHNITAQIDDLSTIQWHLVQTSYPITDAYGGNTTRFVNWTEYELRNAYGIVFHNPGVAKITIPGPVDVSDIPTFNGLVLLLEAVGIDTDALPIFQPQRGIIELYNREYEENPEIMYNPGYTNNLNEINDACSFCNITGFTPPPVNFGDIAFTVDHFTVFAAVANHAPRITSSPATTAYLGELYDYNVRAADVDGDDLTYSLTSAPAGMTVDDNRVLWVPTALGDYDITVVVNDPFSGVDTQSYTLTVREPPKLRINEVEVKVEGGKDDVNDGGKIRDEAGPGDVVEFNIEVCNIYTDEEDIDIENVEATVTIENIDDGDDMDEESDSEDISADDCETLDVEFELPYDAEEGEYDVTIEVEGEDENGQDHMDAWEITLEVERETHQILIRDIRVRPPNVNTGDYIYVDVLIQNIGQDDEDDVAVRIESPGLGIDEREDGIDLDNDMNDDDSVFRKTYRFLIGDDVAPGTYPIVVTTYYDGTRDSETATVNLRVSEAVHEQEEPIGEQQGGDDGSGISDGSGDGSGRGADYGRIVIDFDGRDELTTGGITHGRVWSFRSTDDYLILLIIIIIIDIGLVGFISLLVLFKSRKMRRRRD